MVEPAAAPLRGDGPLTKHAQLRAILLDAAEHRLAPDAPIPSERELMVRFGVSRATVRAAVGQLVSEGRLYRVHGKGTFVRRERVDSRLHLASFTDDMRRRGLDPATLVRSVGRRVPPSPVRAALALADGDTAWRVERLRLAGGAPMALEIGWYPAPLLPDLDALDLAGSLYALLATHYGLLVDRGEQAVWCEVADEPIAALLGVPTGAPLMVFRRTTSAGSAAVGPPAAGPVEHVTSWYRGDRYQVHMTLHRDVP